MISQIYIEVFELDENLQYLLSGLDWEGYKKLLRRAIVGDQEPAKCDSDGDRSQSPKDPAGFSAHRKAAWHCHRRHYRNRERGNELFYDRGGQRTPIRRIYNRAIVDELVRKKLKLSFNFTDDLEVEWAGHPNWYFRMSKFSLPFLRHECVPKTSFLDRVEPVPPDLENYVIKPLFSFAGLGVIL